MFQMSHWPQFLYNMLHPACRHLCTTFCHFKFQDFKSIHNSTSQQWGTDNKSTFYFHSDWLSQPKQASCSCTVMFTLLLEEPVASIHEYTANRNCSQLIWHNFNCANLTIKMYCDPWLYPNCLRGWNPVLQPGLYLTWRHPRSVMRIRILHDMRMVCIHWCQIDSTCWAFKGWLTLIDRRFKLVAKPKCWCLMNWECDSRSYTLHL